MQGLTIQEEPFDIFEFALTMKSEQTRKRSKSLTFKVVYKQEGDEDLLEPAYLEGERSFDEDKDGQDDLAN